VFLWSPSIPVLGTSALDLELLPPGFLFLQEVKWMEQWLESYLHCLFSQQVFIEDFLCAGTEETREGKALSFLPSQMGFT